MENCKGEVTHRCNCVTHWFTCKKHTKKHQSMCNTDLTLLDRMNQEITNVLKSKMNLYCACNYLVSKIWEIYNQRIQDYNNLTNELEEVINIKTSVLDLYIGQISKIFNLGPVFSEKADQIIKRDSGRSPTIKSVREISDIIYEGHWDEDKLIGFGRVNCKDCVYFGDVVDGEFEGKGYIIFNNGQRYEGEFKKGKRHGFGKNFWPKEEIVYEGEFKEGKMNGKGKIFYPNGSFCEATFIDNVKQGEGTYNYKNGDTDSGFFVDDKFEGLVIRKKGEKTKVGVFKNGKLVKYKNL